MTLREDLDQILSEYTDRIVAALVQHMIDSASGLDSSSVKSQDILKEDPENRLKDGDVKEEVFRPAPRPPDVNPNRGGSDALLEGFLEES